MPSTRASGRQAAAVNKTVPPKKTTKSKASKKGTEVVIPQSVITSIVNQVVEKVTAQLQDATRIHPSPAITPEHHLIEEDIAVEEPEITAETLLQNVRANAHSLLSGETETLPAEIFSSPSIKIDARVSDAVRQKIWDNKYFEFSILLQNPIFESKYQLTLHNQDNVQALCLEPLAKTKKLPHIESWISCFHVFVGVYTQKYPNEAPALMKYGEVVQDLAARGHNWRFYDENFRFMRQSQSSLFPWKNIHWELWMRAQQMPKKPLTPTAIPNRGKTDNIPKGYCFRFSKGIPCSGCSYKHLCFKCDGEHQPKSCNFRAQSKASRSATTAAKSSNQSK